MQHIETIELTSSQSSITFSSIPQDYDDLVFVMSLRADRSAVDDDALISFNSSTADFSMVRLYGVGSAADSNTSPARFFGIVNANSATANTFSSAFAYVSNYTSSAAKSFSVDSVTENNATESYQNLSASLWNDTSAITSATITPEVSTNFLAGSTISLYGISAGGGGTVTTS